MSKKPTFSFNGNTFTSITFIGMSGVGKSSIGKALSKHLKYKFLDTDSLIEEQFDMSLSKVVDYLGDTSFIAAEADTILSLKPEKYHIISTGGSVVYSETAMTHLSQFSLIIYLHDELDNIKNRIHNLEKRGIVGLGTKTYDELYNERLSLYQKYANLTVQITHPFNLLGSLNNVFDALKTVEVQDVCA